MNVWIQISNEQLEEVSSFEYLGAIIITEEMSYEEIGAIVEPATVCIARLKLILKTNNIFTSTA